MAKFRITHSSRIRSIAVRIETGSLNLHAPVVGSDKSAGNGMEAGPVC